MRKSTWYEFISKTDYNDWSVDPIVSPRMGFLFTNSSGGTYYYRLLSTAGALRNNLHGIRRKGAYAVFYDPVEEENPTAYPIVILDNTVLVPARALADGLPTRYSGSVEPVSEEEVEQFVARQFLPQVRELGRDYHGSKLIPLEAFCTEQALPYTWDAANHTATVTDPATGKTVVFSAGGPLASKLALREQVRDFLQWLKAEGIV